MKFDSWLEYQIQMLWLCRLDIYHRCVVMNLWYVNIKLEIFEHMDQQFNCWNWGKHWVAKKMTSDSVAKLAPQVLLSYNSWKRCPCNILPWRHFLERLVDAWASSVWKRERATSPPIDEAGKGGRGRGKPDGFKNRDRIGSSRRRPMGGSKKKLAWMRDSWCGSPS